MYKAEKAASSENFRQSIAFVSLSSLKNRHVNKQILYTKLYFKVLCLLARRRESTALGVFLNCLTHLTVIST